MSDVNAIINIDINSSSALVNLKRLESQIDQFNRSIVSSNATAAAAQQSLNKALLDGINNTKLFNSKITPVESSMMRFSRSIDEGRLSLSEYARSAGSQLPGLGRVFRREFDNIEQVATSRVRSMQTQYLALGKTVDGVTKAIASTPTGLAKGLATDLAMTQQRQQIFNKLLDDGSTKLLNWGKNTQWAGRQLMVGFSLPLAAFGAAAAKTFMEIDKATISLKRVYGDLSTTKAELDSNVESVKSLGKEYTKYGITLSDTISLSARAAATGATNEGLMAATEQTLRFATLGQMDYNQALDTTISLQTAFAISNEDLGKTVDYLNAVENQTILTMEDMSLAIPRVATVVKGLGGSVEDLAIMMTAMREGGVSAENAANGLKSGLASLINPTNRASESLNKMGVNLNSIITQNKGDLMGIITEFGTAINKLDEFSRQQVLEQVFGKYQYARMSALFTNITKDAGQAARAMDIAGMSATDLAKISEKELGQISDSTSVKFQAAMEQLKISIAPIGEAFLKGITPVVNMVSKIADAFNNLPDGVKNAMAVVTAVVAGLGPVFLMTVGLLGNGIANLVKGFQFVRKMLAGIKGDASAFTWLAQGELEAVTASKALEGSAVNLTDKLLLQKGAVAGLTAEYERFARAAGIARAEMGTMGGAPMPRGGGRPPMPTPMLRRNTGGTIPGVGSTDTVPAMLTPGEFVINKKSTAQNLPLLHAINDGQVQGYSIGGLARFANRATQFAHATGSRSVSRKEAAGLLRPAELALLSSPGKGKPVPQTEALSRLTLGISDLENQALKVGVGKGLDPEIFAQRIANQKNTPRLFERLDLPRGTSQEFRKFLSEEVGKIKKNPMFDDDLAKAFDKAEKRMKGRLKEDVKLQERFVESISSARQESFTRMRFSIPRGSPSAAGVAEARRLAAEKGLPTYDRPFYYYNTKGRKASALVKVPPDGRIVGVQTDSTRKIIKAAKGGQIPGGKVTQGRPFYGVVTPKSRQLFETLTAWQTSSRAVRENPEMLRTLMSSMSPLQSRRTLTRGTTLGLNRGSEFDPADESAIMDALQSGNIDSIIGREFDMRGPISYTAGGIENAVNAMRQNTDVNRIKFLKAQQSEAQKRHESNLNRVEMLKAKIAKGVGPVDTYKAQLKELEGFISMFPAGQKAMESEIRGLASRGHQELLIQQDFIPGSPVINVDRANPSGTFMGKKLEESEFLSGGSRVRIKGVSIDEKTGVRKLELETIPSDVAKEAPVSARKGNYPGAVGKSGQEIRADIEQRKAQISIMDPQRLLAEALKPEVGGYELSRIVQSVIEKATDPKEKRAILKAIANSRGQEIGTSAWGGYNAEFGYATRGAADSSTWRQVWNSLKNEGTYIPWKKETGPQAQSRNNGGPIFESQTKIVPGVGSTDTVPAMLTPGEFVINKQATKENLPLLHAINNGQSLKRNKGGQIPGVQYAITGAQIEKLKRGLQPGQLGRYLDENNLRTDLTPEQSQQILDFDGTIPQSSRTSSSQTSPTGSSRQPSYTRQANRKYSDRMVKDLNENGTPWTNDGRLRRPTRSYSEMDIKNKLSELYMQDPATHLKKFEQWLESTPMYRGDYLRAEELGTYFSSTRRNKGGQIPMVFNMGNIVPGIGNTDKVPAMLTPGEFVVNKKSTKSNLGLLHAINNGSTPQSMQGFNKGGRIPGVQYFGTSETERVVQSTEQRGSASGSGAYKRETQRIMDVGWDSLQTEKLILETMRDNNEITQSQYDAFKQGETSHITPEVGPNGGKMWRPSNMMADLGLINNYIEAQKGSSKKALGNAKLFDEIQSKTSLSAERLRTELDLLSRGFHATTKESAMALRALSQVGDQTAQKIAVSRVLEARLQGTFYDTLNAPERQYRSDLPTEEKFGKRGKGGRSIPQPETRNPRRPPKVSPQEADRIARQARTEAERSLIAERGVPMTPNSDYEQEIERRAKEIRTREYEKRNREHGREQARIIARSRQSEMQQSTSEMDMNVPSLEENKGDRRRSIGRGLQMGGGAMMMASMAPMMMADQEGNVMGMNAGAVTGGLMGAGMLAEFAPMLMKLPVPILAVGAAAAGVAIGLKILDSNLENSAKAAADFGANVGVTANSLNNVSKMFGVSTPSQRKAQLQLGFTAQEQGQASQFQPMIESESGQIFLKELKDATSADRFKKLSDYIRSGIAAGVMDEQTGNLFAKMISSSLNDAVLGSAVLADLRKNRQVAGSGGLVQLAKKRESAVEGKDLDAYSVMGASIQIIQDYSNAIALANEEFVNGTISYERYIDIFKMATESQDAYSKKLEESLKTTDIISSDRGLSIFNDQMEKILSPEQLSAMKKATERSFFTFADQGIERERKSAIGNAIAGGMDADIAINAMQAIRDQPESNLAKTFEKYSGERNQLELTVFSENADVIGQTLNMTQSLTDKFKELGLSFLTAGGNLAEFQSFITSLPEAIRGSQIGILSNMGGEALQRAVSGGSAIIGAYGQEESAKIFQSKAYTQAQAAVTGTTYTPGQGEVSTASPQNIKAFADIQKSFLDMETAVGTENALKINVAVDSLQNGKTINTTKWIKDSKELTNSAKNIQDNLPSEIASKINIDFTIPKDITQWSNVASQFKDSWDVIKNLDPNIDMAASAKFLTLDSEGNKKNPMEIANSVKKLNQAWANLSSKDKDVKKKAQIDIAVAYAGNIVKEGQTPEEVSKAALERLRSKFKNFDKLPPIKQTQLIQSEIDYQVINLDNAAKIATLQAQATELMKGAMTEGKARMLGSINQQIATLQGQSNIALEKANAEEVSAMETSTDGGGGGGGEKANPLLDLKKSILEQIKMYVDMTATMKDLNSKKLSFVDIILKGQGIFDKLKAIKGIGGGLGSAAREAIMGMGPDAAKKWIEKNTRKNKKGKTVLTKEGQLESDRLEALSIRGTIAGNIETFESSRAQKKAYSNLRGKGLSDSVVQSIAGDPEKAKKLEFLQKKVNANVDGSKKAMWAFLNSEKAAVEQAELLARAQDPIQTQIDDMTLAHKFTSAEIDKQIKIYEDQVDVINKEISAIQELNNKDQNRIRDLDRQKEIINRQIEALSRSNELDQQRADTLKRQDEIRNRTADAISHDLDIMSKKESEIQKAYDKRIKALDEVAKINDYILNQQRSQLGLADALSRGDIAAAAGIQQEMQAGSAQFATQEMRTGLQTGMENQIAGLTTSGGLTRDQAEAQIASIKEQSYQTSLLIRDIEDAIYNRNLEMIPLRNSQLVIDQQIQVIQDAMYVRESAIIVIQDGKLATAQKQLDKELEIKKALDDRFNAEILELELKSDQVKMTDIQSAAVNKLAKQYRGVAEQIKNINDLAAKGIGELVEPIAGATETNTDFAKRKKYYDDEKLRLERERVSAIASITSAIANNPAQIASTAIPAIIDMGEMDFSGFDFSKIDFSGLNFAGMSPTGVAAGGVMGTGGRDSIPAMLTPGEFVMRKASVQKYGTAMLERMNMGSFNMPRYNVQETGMSAPITSTSNNTSINAPVYNTYSVNVNVPNTNADPSMIADKVIMRIGQIDNANIRSLRGNK